MERRRGIVAVVPLCSRGCRLSLPCGGAFHWPMPLGFFARRRRRRLLSRPFPAEWETVLGRNFRKWGRLTEEERGLMRRLITIFAAEKSWEGCAGVEMTDEIRVTVSAQACLLLLGQEEDEHRFFPRVKSILVYPNAYTVPGGRPRRDGVTHPTPPRLGEAHYRGPVVLSWPHVVAGGRDEADGRNLVMHEFAHKLDMLDDVVDGTPPLAGREQVQEWVKVMSAEFARLKAATRRGVATLLDAYGATNEAEFFAVATEAFFERPVAMRDRHPALYEVLRGYYRQDAAVRFEDAV